MTAVAIGPEYQCHRCGREFAAGLVRVPKAWGEGGEAMAEAAMMTLPWPEAASIDEPTLDAQIAGDGARAARAPARARRLLLCTRRRGPRARPPSRAPRRRLDRRPRRPEHAGDVSVGECVGDAAPDADRRRRCRRRLMSPCSAPEPRSRGGRLHRRLRHPDRAGRAPGAASTSRSTRDVAAPGELDVFMPEPGGLTLDAAGGPARRRCRALSERV